MVYCLPTRLIGACFSCLSPFVMKYTHSLFLLGVMCTFARRALETRFLWRRKLEVQVHMFAQSLLVVAHSLADPALNRLVVQWIDGCCGSLGRHLFQLIVMALSLAA